MQRGNSRLRFFQRTKRVPSEYVCSVVRQFCHVWHNSLTLDNCQDIEGVPKNCLKILFQNEYNSYSNALALTGLKSLSDRRNELCLRFARACVKNDQTNSMFPLNLTTTRYDINTRHREKFIVTKCKKSEPDSNDLSYLAL